MTQVLRAALAAAAIVAAPVAAQANLLLNPGFETGTLQNWGTGGDVTIISCGSAAPGCPAGFGNWIATLNNQTLGVGNASLTQSVTVTAPGTYEFGASIAFGTILPARGNFTQGQVSLTVQGPGVSETLGFDVNALGDDAFSIGPNLANFSWTPWRDLTGSLTYTGIGPVSLLINISIQNATQQSRLALDVDNVFIRAVAVPEPAALALLGAGLFGLAAVRRRRV